MLERVADLLEAQDANRFRVRAYRSAAQTIRGHEVPMEQILREGGIEALDALPTIGRTIASHIAELVHRRGLSLLERLEGEVTPERMLTTVPGIGPELAARLHDELHVDTLEELELAAHDGRLASVRGFGPRRIRALQETLASMLGRAARRRARRSEWIAEGASGRPASAAARPEVGVLLAVDREYRARAEAGDLRRIAPRRFNPEGKAWLPVLHVERDGWDLTALFSNTARAHELGRIHDWVVIYYQRDGDTGQCTVVTETHGPLAGRRVVRGREDECAAHARSPKRGGAAERAPVAE